MSPAFGSDLLYNWLGHATIWLLLLSGKDLLEKDTKLMSLRLDVDRMTAEKTDLLAKIEAGEGANTALQQLKEQNVSMFCRSQKFDRLVPYLLDHSVDPLESA